MLISQHHEKAKSRFEFIESDDYPNQLADTIGADPLFIRKIKKETASRLKPAGRFLKLIIRQFKD